MCQPHSLEVVMRALAVLLFIIGAMVILTGAALQIMPIITQLAALMP